ncbi:LysR family transcriptional regulator [uncultured Thomasclavelia sp.]|uniref:LysR family transcriptional regulator n=1 Tax=uncultured Thomasclavelia sp. TaxID=3025759 RepID=UPI0025FEA414|nr:LysR family transcriptional regulator [uncultured Thomasclavelia sp.]
MEIRTLKYFLAVAREENITRAAKFLHITQPTLSRQLMQLEDELDAKLFIRGKNRIVLTDEGMLLRRRAEEIVDLADKTEKEFLEHDNLLSGEIFIGSGETNAMHLLGRVIKEFTQEYPQIKYHLYSGSADDIKERIDKGLVDIGLLSEPVDIEKYEFIRLDYKEVWGVLVPSDCDLAKQEYVTPAQLRDYPLLSTHRSVVQNEIANWFGEDYEKLNIICTYNLIYNAAIMVENGIGYALCFEKLIDTLGNPKISFVPFYPKMQTGTVLVWKKHQIFSPATARFIEKLKQELK